LGGAGAVPDLTVMLFAQPGGLAALEAACSAQWMGTFEVLARLDTSNLGGVEQFGFTDGISQPVPDWNGQRDVAGDQLAYSNVVALGEFLLGYPNEYGSTRSGRCSTTTPEPPSSRRRRCSGKARSRPQRHLRRDPAVASRRARLLAVRARHSGGDAAKAATLAANFVGRTQDGSPLVPGGSATIPGIGPDPADVARNGFTYDDDPEGVRCPAARTCAAPTRATPTCRDRRQPDRTPDRDPWARTARFART